MAKEDLGFEEDPRFKSADREMRWGLYVAAAYTIVIFVVSFGLGAGSPEQYGFTWGLPNWIFVASFIVMPAFVAVVFLVTRFVFVQEPVSLTPSGEPEEEGGES